MSTPPPPPSPPEPAATASAPEDADADADGSTPSSALAAAARCPGPGPGLAPPQRQACAACRHQRRKCKPGCVLAPYFPAEQNASFMNAYRLFGIKNIVRFLDKASPEKKADAMKSVKFEAAAWAEDPVRGAYGALADLNNEYHRDRAELSSLRRDLARCRHYYGAAAAALRPDDAAAAAPGGGGSSLVGAAVANGISFAGADRDGGTGTARRPPLYGVRTDGDQDHLPMLYGVKTDQDHLPMATAARPRHDYG